MPEPAVAVAAFEALPVEAAILDAHRVIIETNPAWRGFGRANDAGRTEWVGETPPRSVTPATTRWSVELYESGGGGARFEVGGNDSVS